MRRVVRGVIIESIARLLLYYIQRMETIELSRMERERESPVISSAVHSADFYNVREQSDLWAMRPSAAQKTWGRKKHEL